MKELRLLNGDCLDKLKELDNNSIDSIVTDPPYGLSFMGKKWDYDVPSVEIWQECLRVLKPGGHLLAFAGSRTYHRMAVRIEDAGFDIRDQIMWIYGSGFPKSHNLIKQIEKTYKCQYTKFAKTQTATTQLKHFQVELNEGTTSSVLTNVVIIQEEGVENKMEIGVVVDLSATDMYIFVSTEDIEQNTILSLKSLLEENLKDTKKSITSTKIKKIIDLQIFNLLQNQNMLKSIVSVNGTALKPAHEPIVMARKPIEGTVAENTLQYGVGGLNIDECRVEYKDDADKDSFDIRKYDSYKSTFQSYEENTLDKTDYKVEQPNELGRWPANIIFDNNTDTEWKRFFYCPKPNKKDKGDDNKHPTVKPTELMKYLIRLVTPKDGIVLDPFMGSGSTGKAAMQEGMWFVGIERETEYYEIAKQRIEYEADKRKFW